jgi:hypothetical protein
VVNFCFFIPNPIFSDTTNLNPLTETPTKIQTQSTADKKLPLFYQSGKNSLVSTSMEIEISSYLGGSGNDEILYMELGENNNVYLAGYTDSWDFPLKNPVRDYISNEGGFLTKIDSQGNLLFSTYIDGSGYDSITYMVLDDKDNVYLMGTTNSSDLITVNAYDDTLDGENDVFLMKFSSEGEIIYSTYLGGSSTESSLHIDRYAVETCMILDSQNNLILTGWTQSNDFPVINAIDDTYNGISDGFISKFTPTGDLLFSSYLGGDSIDGINILEIDGNDNIYLGGITNSTNFLTKNAIDDTYNGAMDIFVSKINSANDLEFNTFIGGSGNESLRQILLNSKGYLYLAGWTNSVDYPTLNPLYDTFSGVTDIVLTEIDLTGHLIKSTYFGGSGIDSVITITEDGNGNLYFAGHTFIWDDFPHTNTINITNFALRAAYVTKLDSMSNLLYSTLIGGENVEIIINSINDFQDDIYLTFLTYSHNLTLLNAFDLENTGGSEILIMKLSSSGELLFSSFLGGQGRESPTVLKYNGDLYITGVTSSSDIPTKKAFDMESGEENGFVSEGIFVKFSPDTDNDKMPDRWELINGLNPVINDTQEDKDSDGMSNLWEYWMNLSANFNDAEEDPDRDGLINVKEFLFGTSAREKDSEADGIGDLYEYLMGLNPQINDAQDDLDLDGLKNINEYQFGSYANKTDTDDDGMDDLFEFNSQLNPNINDANADQDLDGLTNYEEYLIGTSARKVDTDGDTMDDYYEYQTGLNPLKYDANDDKDGDWVSNIMEYRENCDASNPWSVPLFYSEFPFICISLVHVLFLGVIGLAGVFGGAVSFLYLNVMKKRITRTTGARDYETALIMIKGEFPDYKTYLEAEKMHIQSYEEYKFALELKEMEEKKEG